MSIERNRTGRVKQDENYKKKKKKYSTNVVDICETEKEGERERVGRTKVNQMPWESGQK